METNTDMRAGKVTVAEYISHRTYAVSPEISRLAVSWFREISDNGPMNSLPLLT